MENPPPVPERASEDAYDEARLLLTLSADVTASLNLQDVLDKSFHALRRLIDFGGGAIQLIEDGMLVAMATDPPMSEEAKGVRIPVGQGISGTIAATGEPTYIKDIWVDERVHPDGRARGVSTGVRSYFGVPLIMLGAPIGVLQIDSPQEDGFPLAARNRLLSFTPAIAAAVQNARLFERERHALEQTQHFERIQRDFLALVSHELRTPLTSVAGFAQTLQQHAASLPPEIIADFGQRIWRASRRLSRVMGDLLDLSQLERDSLQVVMTTADIGAITRSAALEQTDADHEIIVSVDESCPPASADPDRARQVIGNLLSNARKFSPPGAPIMVDVFSDDGVVVTIADEGRGLPPAGAEHIFDRFVQDEPALNRSAEGLGVGLYLARELAVRMGATVAAAPREGTGTIFTVRFRTEEQARAEQTSSVG